MFSQYKKKKNFTHEFHPQLQLRKHHRLEKEATFCLFSNRTMHHIDDAGGAFDEPILMKFLISFVSGAAKKKKLFISLDFTFHRRDFP